MILKKALFAVAFFLISIGTTSSVSVLSQQEKLETDFMPKQFQWAWDGMMSQPLGRLLEKGDPLQATWQTWLKYHNLQTRNEALAAIEKIVQRWDLHKKSHTDYGYAHSDLEAGWWSSMDMLLLPLLMITAGLDTNNDRFISIGDRLLSRALMSPKEGGSLWPEPRADEGCWFSEYSWDGMTRAQEYYVLNGHLFSLTALYLIHRVRPTLKTEAVIKCAVRGTKSLADKFTGSRSWPLYMINPETINPPHYLIYESIQFEDLYKLTSDVFFKDQGLIRKRVLEKYYPIFLKDDVALGRSLIFSLLGPPHPYTEDLFRVSIECLSPSGRRISFAPNPLANGWQKYFIKAHTQHYRSVLSILIM